MSATLIDGKAVAAELRAELATKIAASHAKVGRKPGLAVILVGDDAASHVYVRNKLRATAETGIASFEYRLPATTRQQELLKLIDDLNRTQNVDGILVQLPLPAHIDTQAVLGAVDPEKDIDGFHPLNTGRLMAGVPGFVPCTPLGCLILIKHVADTLVGKKALVIGRSLTVGKPMALLLAAENCTVTLAHSKTKDLAKECGDADIIVAAVGKPGVVEASWIKQGAIVIDVGINRIDGKLVGDVAPDAADRAGFLTPVPGGVGPMTIACLLSNTYDSFCRRQDLVVE